MRNNQSSFKFGYIGNNQKYLLTTKGTSMSFELSNELVYSTVRILDRRIKLLKKQLFQKIRSCLPLDKEMQLFINHCATIIQKSFRGYQQRKYYRMFKPVLRRFKQLLYAIYMGWKVRRVLRTKQVSKKRTKIKELVSKNQFRQSRIMKRELIEQIYFLADRGRWAQLKEVKEVKKQAKVKIKQLVSVYSKNKENKQEKNALSSKNVSNQAKKNKGLKQDIEEAQNTIESKIKPDYAIEKQITIKAKGFYQIPETETKPSENENKQAKISKKGSINLKSKIKKQKTDQVNKIQKLKVSEDQIESSDTNKTVEKRGNIQVKEETVGQQQKKMEGQQRKSSKEEIEKSKIGRSISNISIHLPIQEIHIQENKLSKNERINTNSEQETSKFKKDKFNSEKKGIFLTISTQKKVNNEAITIKYKPELKKNAVQQKQHINQQKKEAKLKPDIIYEQLKEHDRLYQIFNVYQTTYRKKKQQINFKLKQMRKMKKFLGD